MRGLLDRHTDLAIFVILFLEDLGIPMPIPADVVIMYAGYRMRAHTLNPVSTVLLMLVAVNTAASILYTIVRRGGRPLVDRFGRFIHLDAEHLDRAESWLTRRGTMGITIGRAIPGVRLATVIACGLFKIPYGRFAPAQFAGTVVYMAVFLVIGYTVGPEAVDRIRLPDLSLRLVLLLVLIVGLPLVLRHLNRSTEADDTRTIQAGLTPRERIAAAVFGGFTGLIELTGIWGVAASATNLLHQAEIHRAALMLGRWLQGSQRQIPAPVAYTLDYLVVCLVCLLLPILFFQVIMPALKMRTRKLGRQAVTLWVCILALAGSAIGLSLFERAMRRPEAPSLWLSHSGSTVIGFIALGFLGYAYVCVATRRLAIDRFSDDPELAPSVVVDQGPPPVPEVGSLEPTQLS